MSLTNTLTETQSAADDGQAAPEAAPAPLTGRVQLALNVSDVDAAVEFYSKLFGTGPAKRRPGYANFAVTSPPLKLVLIETTDARDSGVAGALNHLGVEVVDSAQVTAATQRLTGQGLDTLTQDAITCCYAVQDKVWVHDPDGAPWEVYTVLYDAPVDTPAGSTLAGDAPCCGTVSTPTSMSEHGVPQPMQPAARSCC